MEPARQGHAQGQASRSGLPRRAARLGRQRQSALQGQPLSRTDPASPTPPRKATSIAGSSTARSTARNCSRAKELTVDPGVKTTIKDNGAYGLIAVQGSGRMGKLALQTPAMIRFGELTEDEVFVTATTRPGKAWCSKQDLTERSRCRGTRPLRIAADRDRAGQPRRLLCPGLQSGRRLWRMGLSGLSSRSTGRRPDSSPATSSRSRAGVAVGAAIWGGCDWWNHNVIINVNRYNVFNHTNINITNNIWAHNPAHRGNVPYRNAAVAERFGRSNEAAARDALRDRVDAQHDDIFRDRADAQRDECSERARKAFATMPARQSDDADRRIAPAVTERRDDDVRKDGGDRQVDRADAGASRHRTRAGGRQAAIHAVARPDFSAGATCHGWWISLPWRWRPSPALSSERQSSIENMQHRKSR